MNQDPGLNHNQGDDNQEHLNKPKNAFAEMIGRIVGRHENVSGLNEEAFNNKTSEMRDVHLSGQNAGQAVESEGGMASIGSIPASAEGEGYNLTQDGEGVVDAVHRRDRADVEDLNTLSQPGLTGEQLIAELDKHQQSPEK